MSVIKCELQDQYLLITDNPVISAGDINTDSIEFKLDENWQIINVSYYCVFLVGTETLETALNANEDIYRCFIPQNCTQNKGQFAFCVVAKDTNNDVVKTSVIRTYTVADGTNAGYVSAIDWLQFKRDVIDALNHQFDVGLTYSDSNDTVTETIFSLMPPDEVKKFFIDLLNSHIGTMLDYDDSYEDIELNVSLAVDRMNEDARNFSSLNGLVKQTFDTYVTGVDPPEIEPKYLAYMVGINDYCQSVIDKLIDLYGGE